MDELEVRMKDGSRYQGRTRVTLTAALAALLAVACAGPQQPEVRLEGIRVGGLGLRGGTLIAEVMVTNPNSFDLETRSLSYDLELSEFGAASPSWVSVATGTIDERMRVDRRSSRLLEVPIQFRYDAMSGAFRSVLETGTFNYRVTGDVRLSEPIGRTFPYRRSGTVSLDGVRE
ncbi:MAG TPA: LEA type 2 family protein [Longimicrobiales bacterium]|nr:LEA type 2 family protein [Longimicrobiales bacterium]